MSKLGVVNEIHKNVRVNFPRRCVITKNIDDLWQADLIDMQPFSRENRGYRYILTVIDTFSKYAWAYPLKSKKKEDVSKALKLILENGRIPKHLQTDHGTEFYNENVKKVLKFYNINHYSTYSVKKASIVERFIRTLKNKMYKRFSLKGNYKWIDGTLDDLIVEYNHTYHRTIRMKPIDVNNNKVKVLQENILKNATTNSNSVKNKFNVGDLVRISKYKGVFDKGYTPNWSTEIFKIVKVQMTSPVTYLLEDQKHQSILGAFYEQELQKTKNPHIYLIEKVLKRKGKKLLVKWLGLPSSENEWIHKSSIIS